MRAYVEVRVAKGYKNIIIAFCPSIFWELRLLSRLFNPDAFPWVSKFIIDN